VWSYLLRRLLLMLVTLWGITLITFLIIRITPGIAGQLSLGEEGGLDAEKMEEQRKQEMRKLGLDKDPLTHYLEWLWKTVRLDFGETRKDNRPVLDRVLDSLPYTIYLNLCSFTLIYLITIPLGIYSATHQGGLVDKGITLLVYVLYSLPIPFVALGLMMLFGMGSSEGLVPMFPVAGLNSLREAQMPYFPWLADRLWHMVLPVICLTYGGMAFLSRFQRNNMLEVLRQDYIRTAQAKGLRKRTVIYKHALRNSLIPLVTLFATLMPALLGGSVIVETIFSIPGMGKLGFDSVMQRDLNLVMALATVSAMLTLAGLLVTDLLYMVIDPRITLE